MASARALLVPVVATTVLLAGCTGPAGPDVAKADETIEAVGTVDAVETVEVGPDSLDEGQWYDSWEDAAIAEAQRLHPGLGGLTAERVDLTTMSERVVVRAASGYCAVFGGMSLEDRWQANEIMVLSPFCGDR